MLQMDLIDRSEFDFMKNLIDNQKRDFRGAFTVHETTVFYSYTSFWVFTNTNKFRIGLVWLMQWR